MTHQIAILQLVQTDGLGSKTLSRVLQTATFEGVTPEEVVSFSACKLISDYGLSPRVAERIGRTRLLAERISKEMVRCGVRMLIEGDEVYPTNLAGVLRRTSPAVLFVKGNLALFDKNAVGFSGPREPTAKAIAVAQECAAGLAKRGFNIVSGHAAGIDAAAHQAALAAGGATTLVLAEGILRFQAKKGIRELLEDGNHLIVSQFAPDQRWNTGCAMQRNRTICGLSNALIAFEPGPTGGTFATAMNALKLNVPLFVSCRQEEDGGWSAERYFLDRGAGALKIRQDFEQSLDEIVSVINHRESRHLLRESQASLFD